MRPRNKKTYIFFRSFPLQIPLTISEALDKYFLGFVYIYNIRKRVTNWFTKPNRYFSGAFVYYQGNDGKFDTSENFL